MCDYSLHHVASRPAKIGEKLVTTGFPGTSTRGFCAVGEPGVAVCLLPGTEVVFEREAEYEHAYNRLLPLPRLGKLGQTMARFRQVNVEQAHSHHDALEFPDGRIILVSRMRLGQRATVLQLPAAARPEQETTEPTIEATAEPQNEPAKHDPLAV